MLTINPYLNFPGTAEEAFTFYKSVFGGEFMALQRFQDTPEANGLSEEDRKKIMHIALPIGRGTLLMATDALEAMGHRLATGNNFHLSISTESEQETEQLFSKLADGGQVTMPLEKVFWGDYFGMLTDKFGVQWMLSYSLQQQESMSKRAEAGPVA